MQWMDVKRYPRKKILPTTMNLWLLSLIMTTVVYNHEVFFGLKVQ